MEIKAIDNWHVHKFFIISMLSPRRINPMSLRLTRSVSNQVATVVSIASFDGAYIHKYIHTCRFYPDSS